MARVLVVEDDDPIARSIGDQLAREGHGVSFARSGSQALRVYRNEQPDLVVLDVPEFSGIEVCAAIRASSAKQPVIIMLTAQRSLEDAVAGYAAGVDDYVRKPFHVRELMFRIEAYFRRHERLPSTRR